MMETGAVAANMASVAHMSEVLNAAKVCAAKTTNVRTATEAAGPHAA